MKVLMLHNVYQQRGGEDAVVEAEYALLRGAGHEVKLAMVSNKEIVGLRAKTHAFLNAPFNPKRKEWFAHLIADQKPDIVHIHNFFPLLTPAVHEAATQAGCAVVQSLHNYRILCAGAQFLRNGKICEKCLGGNRYWGIVHRCYRNSLPGSASVVEMQNRAFRNNIWHQHVHRFIAQTQFARNKFIAGGLPMDRIVVKPNFVHEPNKVSAKRAGALFVGRLAPEKGLDTLLTTWKMLPNITLTIVGDGPEVSRLKAMAPDNVNFVGFQSPENVSRYMQNSSMLIQPSIGYEGFPMVVAEAFSCGLPIVSTRVGSLAEIIKPNHNGEFFNSGNAQGLANVVKELHSNPNRLRTLGEGARTDYDALYAPRVNLARLEQIYAQAIAQSRR